VVQKLSDRLSKAFMFSALNPEEFKIILDAIQKIDKSAGETIINQGDNGDNLYVVEAGQLICTRIEVSYLLCSLYVLSSRERKNRKCSESTCQVRSLESWLFCITLRGLRQLPPSRIRSFGLLTALLLVTLSVIPHRKRETNMRSSLGALRS